jgi:hypothetical protein
MSLSQRLLMVKCPYGIIKKKVHLSSGKYNSTTLYKRVFQNTTLLKTHIEHTLKKNVISVLMKKNTVFN